MLNLNHLKFAKTHEWISHDGKVGISEHAQKEITDVVFVEFPSIGKSLAKEEEAGSIESVKAAFPIYAPCSGKVITVNENVAKDPSLVNQSPYENGWFFQLEIKDANELQNLMTYDQYQEFLKTEVPSH